MAANVRMHSKLHTNMEFLHNDCTKVSVNNSDCDGVVIESLYAISEL